MKAFFSCLLAAQLLLISSLAGAASTVGQHYIDRIVNGGPSTVRDAARSIQKSGFSETEVLDVLAERLVQDYQKSGKTQVDASAWVAIALGDSGNKRYYQVLSEVANTAIESKVAKHAKGALKKLKSAEGDQYIAGSVALQALRDTNAAANPAQAAAPVAQSGRNYVPISQIQVGMSQAEANDLAGPPTATTSHITGKAFQPFNFKGKDTARSYSLYKGQGRIVFSNESAYNSTWRVREVIIDPSETGYP
ncbi:hypothetical protein [Cellvibrio polysaccharolyticus]|uniref:Uncharacterized protein n=1 Tax=Cellvibrio polysaccharolyticus TaxID=2082724 RepID=A0A928YU87_9GAMM|nr:hypothetical protein [Cellvibrio polysaccharolyticus]MBE8715858.1 hypothetical protein [Cellvibrio polysaccharolyticus]